MSVAPGAGEERSARRVLTLAALALVVLVALSLFVGRYPRPYWMPPELLGEDALARQLVLALRAPRLVAAALLGATLAASGFAMQMLFRNPLVEPGFLGVSQGAAFGAALAIVALDATAWGIQGLAAGGALLALAATLALSRAFRFGAATLRLVLAGIAVSALFASGVGLLKLMADPQRQLPEITFWMLGGLAGVGWRQLLAVLPAAAVSLLGMHLLRWRLNVLSLDDATAFSLGVAVRRERRAILLLAVVGTAAMVSVAGMVGWLGLITPHLARRLVGADARRALPTATLLGALGAVACDDLARTLVATEIPLGLITSFVGAAAFAIGMARPPGRVRG
ncbi:MAG: iron ABC transporter permease [Holophagales bacterium]|nr:MAG: iron ABC transporter permease [Holophagales bacterium]